MCVKINSFSKQKKRRRKAIENVETIKWAAQCYGFTSFRMGEQVYGCQCRLRVYTLTRKTRPTPWATIVLVEPPSPSAVRRRNTAATSRAPQGAEQAGRVALVARRRKPVALPLRI